MLSPMTQMDDAAKASQQIRRSRVVNQPRPSQPQAPQQGQAVSPAQLGQTIQAPKVPAAPARPIPTDWMFNVAQNKPSGQY